MLIGEAITKLRFDFDHEELKALLATAKSLSDLIDFMISNGYTSIRCPYSDFENEDDVFSIDELEEIASDLRALSMAKVLVK